jgi:predicted glycogen debranching enzyme
MARRLLDKVIRPLELPADPETRARTLVESEWLVTNGIGGYSSGTVSGVVTRRYHGVLVAALPNPLGRTVMLNHIDERFVDGGATSETPAVSAFRLEAGLPVWELAVNGTRIEKRLVMIHGQNTVHVQYRLLDGTPVTLELRPSVHFRNYEAAVDTALHAPGETEYVASTQGRFTTIRVPADDFPALTLEISAEGWSFAHDSRFMTEVMYPVEESRGYVSRGRLWSPGFVRGTLDGDAMITLVASTEDAETAAAVPPQEVAECERERRRRLARVAAPGPDDVIGTELVLAADQFIITPRGRLRDTTRAKAVGDEIRTVIAGYHWFTDWGRDTMISLEGLTLVTGRHREAGFILRTFAQYVRDGLIPNMFPDGSNEGLYHTADATLWFFHAVHRYIRATGDDEILFHLLPVMKEIVDRHIAGTRFGIGMDPGDSLLRQGADGHQLTWMDAKVDGWVVTPRRGKAVEINALWYNALCLLSSWLGQMRSPEAARPYTDQAARVAESFNRRFWNEERGYLYDVIEGEHGDSPECRPNQLFAISLDNPVLAREHWESVIAVAEERLLTPVGLRSLAPGEAEYKPRYFGDLRTRDAAYHQGTVWGWLIGPFIDAWLKVHPDDVAGARRLLGGLVAHLGEFGVGSIAEIFDATEPYTPRGCIAQAWSVAETLRCWVRTDPGVDLRKA